MKKHTLVAVSRRNHFMLMLTACIPLGLRPDAVNNDAFGASWTDDAAATAPAS